IECVIITEAFSMSVSCDTVLQATGRSGRPGKSKISIVIMSGRTYDRIFRSASSADVEKIILRTNYYLQNQGQFDILEIPKTENNFLFRQDCLLSNLRK